MLPLPPRGFPNTSDQILPMVLFGIPVMAGMIGNIHNIKHSNMIKCSQYVIPPIGCTFFMRPICAFGPCLLYETCGSYQYGFTLTVPDADPAPPEDAWDGGRGPSGVTGATTLRFSVPPSGSSCSVGFLFSATAGSVRSISM